MFSATDFLPACITEFMNLVTTILPNLGSGRISRLSALWRRDISLVPRLPFLQAQSDPLFGPLCSVFRPALLAVLDALGIEHAAQNVVAHARKVLDAAAADHHHRVLLQVMALAGDVTDHFEAVGQAHLGDLAQRRVRLLRRRRVDAGAHAALLRRLLQRRHLLLGMLHHARLANELIDRRHPCRLASVRGLVRCRTCTPVSLEAGARAPANPFAQNQIAPSALRCGSGAWPCAEDRGAPRSCSKDLTFSKSEAAFELAWVEASGRVRRATKAIWLSIA